MVSWAAVIEALNKMNIVSIEMHNMYGIVFPNQPPKSVFIIKSAITANMNSGKKTSISIDMKGFFLSPTCQTA